MHVYSFQSDCMEPDQILTIDTDKIDMVDAYSIIKTEKNKYYKCKQCDVSSVIYYFI